jgi:hypothetical protein
MFPLGVSVVIGYRGDICQTKQGQYNSGGRFATENKSHKGYAEHINPFKSGFSQSNYKSCQEN